LERGQAAGAAAEALGVAKGQAEVEWAVRLPQGRADSVFVLAVGTRSPTL
jgi:hypothetical protein